MIKSMDKIFFPTKNFWNEGDEEDCIPCIHSYNNSLVDPNTIVINDDIVRVRHGDKITHFSEPVTGRGFSREQLMEFLIDWLKKIYPDQAEDPHQDLIKLTIDDVSHTRAETCNNISINYLKHSGQVWDLVMD